MSEKGTRDHLLAKYKALTEDYEKATIEWILAGYKGNKEAKEAANEKRTSIAGKTAPLYWDLDPYVRARSLYDRLGIIQPEGKIDFYPERSKTQA